MRTRFVLTWVAILITPLLLGVQVTTRIREPIGAGTWYPADQKTLRNTIEKYVAEAEGTVPQGRLVACLVPHQPYGLSGDVAAHAFKLLQTGQYSRVVVLAPSHYATFRGCSIPAVQAYRTPLGEIPLDGPAIRTLTYSTLISRRAVKYTGGGDRQQVHEREYSIEAVLPFLQVQLGLFWLVPIVVGDLRDYQGGVDHHAIDTIVRELEKVIDDQTLIILSTDLTHHGNAFSYRPFRENVLEGVERLDGEALRLILERDAPGFEAYLERTKNSICGKTALHVFMKLLPRQAQGHLLDYDISARRTKDTSNAVGYAAIAFIDPTRPPAEPRPEAALPPPRPTPPPAPAEAPQAAEPAAPSDEKKP